MDERASRLDRESKREKEGEWENEGREREREEKEGQGRVPERGRAGERESVR